VVHLAETGRHIITCIVGIVIWRMLFTTLVNDLT